MAKIYGELEKAQLENIAGDPTSTVAGYIAFNTSSTRVKYATGSGVKEFVETDTAQTLTNKYFDGGTASSTNIIEVPSNTTAGINSLSRKASAIYYSTDAKKFYGDDGSTISELGAGTPEKYNYIMNPACTISQRGTYTSATTAAHVTYYLDRYKTYLAGVTANIQQITSSQPSGLVDTKSYKFIATSTGTATMAFWQYVENYGSLAGKSVTFSCYVKANRAAHLMVYDGASQTASSAHTGGGAWERLTVTKTMSASTSQCRCDISTNSGSASTVTSGNYIEFTGAQLIIGSTTIDFVQRPYQLEMDLCKRYYNLIIGGHISSSMKGVNGFFQDSTTWYSAYNYPVPMRVTPTLDYSSAGNFSLYGAGFNAATATISSYALTTNSGLLIATVASGGTQGRGAYIEATSSSARYGLDAEY